MPIETFYISPSSTHNKQQAGIIIICTEEREKSYDRYQKNVQISEENGIVPPLHVTSTWLIREELGYFGV